MRADPSQPGRLPHRTRPPAPRTPQLKPGLSAYADKPADGAASLKPLLEKALEVVPPELRAQTPIEVRATAGLRLLPGEQADHLLEGPRRPSAQPAATPQRPPHGAPRRGCV